MGNNSVSSIVSAVGSAAKIVLDRSLLDIRTEQLNEKRGFLAESSPSPGGSALPTVIRYQETVQKMDQLMRKYNSIIERDLKKIRTVRDNLEQADKT